MKLNAEIKETTDSVDMRHEHYMVLLRNFPQERRATGIVIFFENV